LDVRDATRKGPLDALDGSTFEVIVKALPLSKMEAYLIAEADVCAVVKLCTDADPDELHPDSALAIADAAEELNSPFGERLLARAKRLNARYEQPTPNPSPKPSPTLSPAVAPQAGTPPKS